MRIVLIAYHFPPDPAVGSLRAEKLARAFASAGHLVDVVTAPVPQDARARDTGHPSIAVHPVSPLPSPRELVRRITRGLSRVNRSAGSAGSADPNDWKPPSEVPGWYRLLSSLLWLPDDRQGFIIPAFLKARSLVRQGASLVYSTAPPYSPHLAALLTSWACGVKWTMELRDPWVDNHQKPWWVRSAIADAADAFLERLCIRRASLLVTVSEGIRRRLLERLALPESRVLVILNGIAQLSPRAPRRRTPGPLRIAHIGTFYYDRDPRPFLRGLAAARRRLQIGAERVHVDLVGACRMIGEISVEKEIAELGLVDVVRIQDWLPHAEAARIIENADLLLLLAQKQPDQVPNKLYEYLGARKPILAFADPDGETARMLRRAGGHHVIASDDDRVLGEVLDSILTPVPGDPVSAAADEDILEEWATETQMERLMSAMIG